MLRVFLLFFIPLVTSLSVTGSSSCYDICDGRRTGASNIVCTDSDYEISSQGKQYKDCLTCESTSTAYNNATDNDIYWFLFNMKYVAMNCIFTHPTGAAATTCNSSCAPLRATLTQAWFKANNTMVSQYEYCSWNNGAFVQYSGGCASCLIDNPGSVDIGNFLNTMQSACSSKPHANKAETVTLPTSPLFVETNTNSGLSTGAKAGIGIGVSVAGVIIIAVLGWAILRYRRRKTHARLPVDDGNDPSPRYSQNMDMTAGQVVKKDNGIQQPAELGEQQPVHEMPGSREPQELPG